MYVKGILYAMYGQNRGNRMHSKKQLTDIEEPVQPSMYLTYHLALCIITRTILFTSKSHWS